MILYFTVTIYLLFLIVTMVVSIRGSFLTLCLLKYVSKMFRCYLFTSYLIFNILLLCWSDFLFDSNFEQFLSAGYSDYIRTPSMLLPVYTSLLPYSRLPFYKYLSLYIYIYFLISTYHCIVSQSSMLCLMCICYLPFILKFKQVKLFKVTKLQDQL